MVRGTTVKRNISFLTFLRFFCFAVFGCGTGGLLSQANAMELLVTPAVMSKVEKDYGDEAAVRISQWQDLIESISTKPDMEKLHIVNHFFNQLRFVEDTRMWAQEDYWATPLELLVNNGGDCEDFAIAKYVTLKASGVNDEKLRITYVKAIELDQAHMVLTYYPKPDSVPLVLDNLTSDIKPASQRKDLVPVYSFNGEGLWLARQRGEPTRLGRGDDVSLWREVKDRMAHYQLAKPGGGP